MGQLLPYLTVAFGTLDVGATMWIVGSSSILTMFYWALFWVALVGVPAVQYWSELRRSPPQTEAEQRRLAAPLFTHLFGTFAATILMVRIAG